MGHREALLCNCLPAPASFAPSPQRAGGSERLDCPKLRIGKLVRRPLPRLPGDFGGCPRLPGPVAAPCPPQPRPTLSARGSGGQEGEKEPPAAPGRQLHGAHCGSGPMAPAGPGWGAPGAAGGEARRLAPERVPCEAAGCCLEERSLLVSLGTLEGNLSPTTSFLYFLEPALLLHLLLLL